MGISSHQVRLLQLTDRRHTIGRVLNQLASDKLELTRDMSKATRKYQEELNSKVLKWSNNSGITYQELSYNNLMKPSQMNANSAYLLTDSADRVVIDNNYKKYAEMISAKGAPGGNWEGNRAKILSEILGIPETSINNVESYSAEVDKAKANLDATQARKPNVNDYKTSEDLCCLLKDNVGNNLGSSHAKFVGKNIKDWAQAFQHGGKIDLGSNDPHNVLSNVGAALANGLSKIFITESTDFDPEKSPIIDAINEVVEMQEIVIDNQDTSSILTKDGNNYQLDVQKFIDDIMTAMAIDFSCKETNNDYKIDYPTTAQAKQYLAAKASWQADVDAAKAIYTAALDAENTLFTADQERQIEFYDDLFSTIADKGWTYNESVKDEDYLNQMLQNGIYTITTVDRKKVEDETTLTEDYYWQNTYNTDIATNFTNIFTVNDDEGRLDAQVEYEKTKSIINQKETQIDTRMQNLKTEQDAINTMIQTIQSIIDENVEDKFSIFG